MVLLEYFFDIILLAALWRWEVDSACMTNEDREYFLKVKAAGASGRQPYHLYVSNVMKFWPLRSPVALGDCPRLEWNIFTLYRVYLNSLSYRLWKVPPLPIATTCPLRLRGLKCNRLLKLGCPVGAVTLSR